MGNLFANLWTNFFTQNQAITNDQAITTKLTCLRNDLLYIIDIEHGLLSVLRELQVLTYQQIEIIRSKSYDTSQVNQLLDDLIGASRQQQELFLEALKKSQQLHACNYISANGSRSEVYANEWPLYDCRQEINRMENNWSKLIETIDSVNGLLDELYSVKCINGHHQQCIEARDTDERKNDLLLNIIRRRSVGDYRKFLSCLQKTKQYHVVWLLDDNATAIRPLNERQIARLESNHSSLVFLIHPDALFLWCLLADECITPRQKEYIETAPSRFDKTKRLLKIVRRGSEPDFDNFVGCLKKTHQDGAVSALEEDGVVVQVVAKTAVTDDSTKYELRLVEQSVTPEGRQLLIKVAEQLGFKLIAIAPHESVVLFFLCKSLADVLIVSEMTASGELINIVRQLFADLLLGDADQVIVEKLAWEPENYGHCVQFFCSSTGLPVTSCIYRLAQEMRSNHSDFGTSLLRLDALPHEILESIVTKAAAQLFVVINRQTPRSEVYTMATICAVSLLWHKMLNYREFNKRNLKQYFRVACRPYKPTPRLMSTLFAGDNQNVMSVAELNGKLYVACSGSSTFQVYTSVPPFDRLDDIKVGNLEGPTDVVACRETTELYIGDINNQIVWRMAVLSNDEVRMFTRTTGRPWTLSTRFRRLLVTAYDGDALYHYDEAGEELRRIALPDSMYARHAVETTRNTYIVSHRNRWPRDSLTKYNGITEMDVNGLSVRRYSCTYEVAPRYLNYPQYLDLDDSHIVVADRNNERIVLVNLDLQLSRILLPTSEGQPMLVRCDNQRGFLFISYWRTGKIDIYRFRQRERFS